jgi:hypothetical protein
LLELTFAKEDQEIQ